MGDVHVRCLHGGRQPIVQVSKRTFGDVLETNREFCKRCPKACVLAPVNRELVRIPGRKKMVFDSSMHYGWCMKRWKIKEVGARECLGPVPTLTHFVCEGCSSPLEDAESKTCPGCDVPVFKSMGCNHMTCTQCQCHWCWVCSSKFDTASETYDHLDEMHGGIFDDAENDVDSDASY